VLQSEYSEKCDIWSIGVILYILLSGKPPFDGNDDREIVKNVKLGQYSMSGPEWKNISKEAIELIKKMLTYDPVNRYSAEQAINHTWIKKKVNDVYDTKATINALTNLRTFRVFHLLI
jgi:calcium-dependent protein kinase